MKNNDNLIQKNKSLVLFIDDFPILNTQTFVCDVIVNKKQYRIFYHSGTDVFLANEIISYDYQGSILLRNPPDRTVSSQIQDLIKKLPRNNRLDTIAHAKQQILKFNKQENRQPKNKVGRPPNSDLTKATLWCIKSHPKHSKVKTETIRKAYPKFGSKTHSEESFITSVRKIWNGLLRKWRKQSEEFRSTNSFEIFAESELRTSRNAENKRLTRTEKD